ncbi:MAG: chemotaxis protein CheW [Oceanidesulfovibrio sp.]
MNNTYLSMSLGDLVLALPLESVHKVALMVAITPLGEEGIPRGMLGVLSLGGRIVPVFDPLVRLGQEPKIIDPSDHIVFAWAGSRMVGLCVDEAGGVFRESPQNVAAASDASRTAAIAPGSSVWKDLRGIAGIAPLADGLAVIRDLDAFLSEEDQRLLDEALDSLDDQALAYVKSKEEAR